MIMSDYDMQIMVAVVFSCVLFSGFMFLYEQEPNIDYTSTADYDQNWSAPQNATDVSGTFDMMDVYGKEGIWLVSLFVSAMIIIGVLIALRFLWW
jgi:hypothetical protein